MPQRIREATAISIGAQTAVMGLAVATQILVSRSLGPDNYGLYRVVVGGLTLTTVLVSSGVWWSLGKFVADFDAKGDDEGISAAYVTALRFQGVLLLLTMALLASLAPVLTKSLFRGEAVPYVVLTVGTLFFGFQAVFSGVLLGLREVAFIALIRLAQASAALILIGSFLYVLDLGVNGAIVAYGLSLLVATLTAAGAVKLVAASRLPPTDRRLPQLRWFGGVVTLNTGYDMTISVAVPVLVSLLITDGQRDLVGYAGLLVALGVMADSLLLSIYRAGYPFIARWQATAQTRAVARFVAYLLAGTLAGYAGALILGSLWGDDLIGGIYGEPFRPAATYIGVAILSLTLYSVHRLVAFVLYAHGRQNRVLRANALGSMALLISLIALGVGSDANPIDVVFFSTAAAAATSLAANGLLSYRERRLTAAGATLQPSPATVEGGTNGWGYNA